MDFNIFFICIVIQESYNNLHSFIIKIFKIIKNEKVELNKTLIDKCNFHNQFDFDDSKICELNFFSETIYNFLAVIIYSFSEKSFKKILLKNNLSIENLKEYFEEKYSLDLTTLLNYQKYNELRLLNNCVKHKGFVDNKLAKCNNKWKQGEEIILEEDDIKEYFNNLVDFIPEILSKISKSPFTLFHIE